MSDESRPVEGAGAVVLFDGVCNLCNRTVRFLYRREGAVPLHFASLQSEVGRALLREHGLPEDALDSMVLVDADGAHRNSTAVLRTMRLLRRPWSALGVLLVVPRVLRDPLYALVARTRYRLWGRTDACPLPEPGLAERFLGS